MRSYLRPERCSPLVLRSDGLDGNTFGRVGFEELQEVLGVARVIHLAYAASQHGTVRLHPAGRTPGSRKQKQVRVFPARFAQRGQDVRTVVLDRKALQVWIRCPFVETVQLSRVVTRSDTGAADVKSQLRRVE